MAQPELPPPAHLMNLISGRFISQAIGTVARLGIADQLKDGPRTAEEVATRVNAHGPSVYRLLRALTMVGVFVEQDGHRFALTPVGELLRTDVPSLAGAARMFSAPWHAQAWFELDHSVRTGEAGFVKAFGQPLFDWFPTHEAEAQVFHEAMVSFSSSMGQAVVASYDFSRFSLIADIGGGHGTLLSLILGKTPGAKGIVYDLPEVVKGARPLLEARGVSARAETVGGDFFQRVPAADAYVIKHIIHDWSDDAAATILRNCASSMNPGGRVLLVEMVVPAPGEPSFAKILDLEMLIMTSGGRERTEAEYRALFASAGLKLERIVPTASPVSVIEASKA